MAIQFLLVTFPEERTVLADGSGVGFTNHILMLPGDEYEITLGGGGYSPASRDIALAGTSMVKPMVVNFAASPMPAARVAPATPAASAAAPAAPAPVAARQAQPVAPKPDPKAKKNA